TIHPPTDGFANTIRPATISMPPTICMNTSAEKGNIEAMEGFKYRSQFVSRSANLSAPATIGTIPKVILSTVKTDLAVGFEAIVSIFVYLFKKPKYYPKISFKYKNHPISETDQPHPFTKKSCLRAGKNLRISENLYQKSFSPLFILFCIN